jgi:hypothetical protein
VNVYIYIYIYIYIQDNQESVRLEHISALGRNKSAGYRQNWRPWGDGYTIIPDIQLLHRWKTSFKGTVPRDFSPQLFFVKHISLDP